MPQNQNTAFPDLNPESLAPFPGKLHANWHAAANVKGFDLIGRAIDRYHLVLRCQTCARVMLKKRSVVVDATPLCHGCIHDLRVETAELAGIRLDRRDTANRHYGQFRLGCGHEKLMQFGQAEKVARGEVSVHCSACQIEIEAAEAAENEWRLVGADPEGNPSFRIYAHGCGTTQRIARANMQTGRFCCKGCGEAWNAARSYIYLMQFELGDGSRVLKAGFSRNPDRRLRFQLCRREMACELLRQVPISSGHKAMILEKRLHAHIRRAAPGSVLPPERFRRDLKVTTEIYSDDVEGLIHSLLDEIVANNPSG